MENPTPTFLQGDLRTKARMLMSFADAYRGDEDFRSRAAADPRAVLTESGINVQDGPEVRISENTAEAFHLVMPPDPNIELSDETLNVVVGGKSASTIGSGSSAATLGTSCTTGSSASSIASAASSGSKG